MARPSRNSLIGRKNQAVSEYSFLAYAASEYSLIADIRSRHRTVPWATTLRGEETLQKGASGNVKT